MMGYWAGPSEQNRQEDLEIRVRKLERFAIVHQQWVQDVMDHDTDIITELPEPLHSQFLEVQRLRHEAMKMD
jgi:hypothetical protein